MAKYDIMSVLSLVTDFVLECLSGIKGLLTLLLAVTCRQKKSSPEGLLATTTEPTRLTPVYRI